MGKRHNSNENPELFQILLNEYAEIRVNPEKELSKTGRSELYTDLTKLIVKISDYFFCEEDDIWKGLGDIMGGKVRELESESRRIGNWTGTGRSPSGKSD